MLLRIKNDKSCPTYEVIKAFDYYMQKNGYTFKWMIVWVTKYVKYEQA